jgi:hypothetical protein
MPTDPLIDAIIRLEHWLSGGADFKLKSDVRLLIDSVREVEGLACDVDKIAGAQERLQRQVEDLDRRLRGVM